jgi:hypothetical protein
MRLPDRCELRRTIKHLIAGSIALVSLSNCNEVEHPNLSKYEYRYSDGAFVAPYRTFRGGFEHFQYIFRPRT